MIMCEVCYEDNEETKFSSCPECKLHQCGPCLSSWSIKQILDSYIIGTRPIEDQIDIKCANVDCKLIQRTEELVLYLAPQDYEPVGLALAKKMM